MDLKNAPDGGAPRLAVRWPACEANTVHVTFAGSNWETPGVKLERQPDGEFMCFMGEQSHFEEIFFKFIIDGTKWEVNRSIPVVFDKDGYENNRWTSKEATEYHDSCFRLLQRRLTLANINLTELCRLALSIHGDTNKDGRQLECVVDENGSGIDSRTSLKFSMSGSSSEIVFLHFQPLGGQSDSDKVAEYETPNDNQEIDGYIGKIGNKQKVIIDGKNEKADDTWVAKFPADLGQELLPYQMSRTQSTSEKERLMESECATLHFLNEHTKVPAPKIYAYDVRYKSLSKTKPEPTVGWSDPCTKGFGDITENKVEWPFILMGNLGSMPPFPCGLPMDSPWEGEQISDKLNHLNQMILQQIFTYRIELAEHPLAACGYLTLDKSYWKTRNKPNSRKIETPKSAFGIRPCIYDTCEPFTSSIVAAFKNHPGEWIFPPARAFNSLNSITTRFEHLLTHGNVSERDHFVALWQLRALLYELFGSRYENGPFILHYPDLPPENILISSGLIDWGRAAVVPIQIAACPPRITLGQLHYNNTNDPGITSGTFQLRATEVLSRYQVERYANMKLDEAHMANQEHNITTWEDSSPRGKELFLSQVLTEEMFLPMCLLDELCNGSINQPLIGKATATYFPLIYKMVKGHSWDSVKEAVMNKGAMRFVLQDWEEEQRVKATESIDCNEEINAVEDKNDGTVS